MPSGLDIHIVLVEPEIPQNTGNVARLCLATGATLHLVGRLGFHIDDRSLQRAGLDYWQHVQVVRHKDLDEYRALVDAPMYYFSRFASRSYVEAEFPTRLALVFGSESKGLPEHLRSDPNALRIPIFDERVRSLNLATSVGIVLYEAIRQGSQSTSELSQGQGIG